jgi:hypothetical protein
MNVYSRLYGSTLAWYQKWYSTTWQLHFAAITGLTLSMCFNSLTLAHLAQIVGFSRLSYLDLDGGNAKFYLSGILCVSVVINVAFARKAIADLRMHKASEFPASRPGKIAIVYMASSFGLYIATLFGALVMRARS